MTTETSEDVEELLFFDTFSHEVNEDLNLDLVQFPKPVYITEVRIIPLGARVQADFPGGVRLGATNPSKFHIEFFVNDLGKPGASTFECLGDFEYNQNDCIHLDCVPDDPAVRQIPTDGLVLRGWYTTITLAVYGKLTKAITEPIVAAVAVEATLMESVAGVVPIAVVPIGGVTVDALDAEFVVAEVQPHGNAVATAGEFYEEPAGVAVVTKERHGGYMNSRDRSSSGSDWDRDDIGAKKESTRQPLSSVVTPSTIQETPSSNRHRTTSHRDRSRSSSRERDYHSRSSKRDWSHSPDYRHSSSRRTRTTSYEQRYGSSKSERTTRDHDRRRDSSDKRPRTPPMHSASPRRPRTPEPSNLGGSAAGLIETPVATTKLDAHDKSRKYDKPQSSIRAPDHSSEAPLRSPPQQSHDADPTTTVQSPTPEPIADANVCSPQPSQGAEPFEPILSDEEIADDTPEPIFDDSDVDYANLENVLKPFDPNTAHLEKFPNDCPAEKEVELANKILHKITERDQFCISTDAFLALPADAQEMWVHSCEHFLQSLHLIHAFPFDKRSAALDQLLVNHSATIVSLIKVGLDWHCAMAQPQPAFKLRHLKIGARLAQLLGGCNQLIAVLLCREHYDLFARLFALYSQQFMALSIRLQLIKAIYACLDSKVAMDYFLSSGTTPVYQQLVQALQSDPPTRAKFALRSLLKKVNLYESLQLLREIVTKIFVAANFENQSTDHQLVTATLEEIHKAYARESISYTQPKRFLPVTAKFEIVPDKSATRSAAFSFHAYFECHALLETLLVLLANRVALPQNLLALSLAMVEALARTPTGLEYMYNRVETTRVLVQCLLDEQDTDDACTNQRVAELGTEIAFKIRAKYCLDAVSNLAADQVDELTDALHALYALLTTAKGREYGAATIAMDSNILVLLDVIERERKLEMALTNAPRKLQSPIIGYAVDALDITLRHSAQLDYLADHGGALIELVKSSSGGQYDESIDTVLQEMALFLKPIELPNVFGYDNILSLCDYLKQSFEFIVNFPGDVITTLRVLHHLAVGNATTMEDEPLHIELKHKFVVLQLYSADGISILCTVLDKLCAHFELPSLHAPQLATQQGILTTQILLPTVLILQRMLTHVIRSRDAQFRDLTAIPPLLRAFNLAHHIPLHSPAAAHAATIQHTIIQTLLAYTQPAPPEGSDTEAFHKSLWTQMLGELLKYTLVGPSHFMSGLTVLTQLLPVTMPVVTLQPLLETEVGRLITERQLWSAHLHPRSIELTELIQIVAPTTQPDLQHLLQRACLQLADLAPNMSLLVAKSLVDLTTTLADEPHSQEQLLRLLIRLAQHAIVKVSLLSMLAGKFSELLVTILKIGTNATAQALVFELVQALMDPDIVLDNSQLANGLPSKEVMALFVVAAVEFFLATRSEVALRTMQRMTRIDLPLFLLRSVLDTKKEQLNTALETTAAEPMLDFLIDFVDVQSEHRTSQLGPNDLAIILNWRRGGGAAQHTLAAMSVDAEHAAPTAHHPIQKLADAAANDATTSPELQLKFQCLLAKLAQSDQMPELSELPEPALGLTDGIVQQFGGRQLYSIADRFDAHHDFWPRVQIDVGKEGGGGVTSLCDLSEVIKGSLSLDTNVTADCKRLLHLSASPQSARERTQAAPCFRTRRVELEPTTGRPDKKIYVARGRGFGRVQPNRSDLFRSRPPNTSRPPSLHVDDFLALETCGAQPTGPTGYNKMSRDIISIRGTRGGRGRGGIPSGGGVNAFGGGGGDRGRLSAGGPNSVYRQNIRRTNSPGTWNQNMGSLGGGGDQAPQHFRTATAEPVVSGGLFQLGGGGNNDYSNNNLGGGGNNGGGGNHFGGGMQRGRTRGGIRGQRPFQR